MKIGILGTGQIAQTMARTLAQMPGVERRAVASRDPAKAKAFAEHFGFEIAYGSYEELARDDEIGLVYVATPHSRHFEDALLCLTHGRGVLCEKAFTVNVAEAETLARTAREKGVFLAEAMWPRYMPSRKIVRDLLASGEIGRVYHMSANYCAPLTQVERLMQPELAGGALLDLGVYGLNFALMHFGRDIARIDTTVRMTDTGVDGSEVVVLTYADGRMATLTHSLFVSGDSNFSFFGDKGRLVVDHVANPRAALLYDAQGRLRRRVDMPPQITGYEYEAAECVARIEAGERESLSMPLSETLFLMRLLDELRSRWGFVYPKEKI